MKKILWLGAVLFFLVVIGYFFTLQSDWQPKAAGVPKPNLAAVATMKSDSALSTIAAKPVDLVVKAAAQRLRKGDRLAQLHAELVTGKNQSPSSQYIAAKIVQECLLTSHISEATYVPPNANVSLMSIEALRKLKKSCEGLDVTRHALKQVTDQKKLALENGDPAAMAEQTFLLPAQGLKADAFSVALSLLKKFPDDPAVLENAIGMLPAMGIPIGSNDAKLKNLTYEQASAALFLSICDMTSSCSLNDSVFLQNECVLGGRCSPTSLDYVAENMLPSGEMSLIPAATARMKELIAQKRWDLIGYSDANRPSQSKPSVLSPMPKR